MYDNVSEKPNMVSTLIQRRGVILSSPNICIYGHPSSQVRNNPNKFPRALGWREQSVLGPSLSGGAARRSRTWRCCASTPQPQGGLRRRSTGVRGWPSLGPDPHFRWRSVGTWAHRCRRRRRWWRRSSTPRRWPRLRLPVARRCWRSPMSGTSMWHREGALGRRSRSSALEDWYEVVSTAPTS